MRVKNINFKKYWIKKLLFSKIYTIDTPGIIISESAKFLSPAKTKKRDIYHFEKIFSDLQIKTIKELGPTKASEFFYNLGKDLGVVYLYLAKIKKIPCFLMPSVIKKLCEITWSCGASLSTNLDILEDGKIIISGSDNLFCRKFGNVSFFAGFYSGVVSYLYDKNIEAKVACEDCPKRCKIILDPKLPKRYLPDKNKLKLQEDKEKLNIPKVLPKSKRPSFSDLLKHKKITFSDSKTLFMSQVIFSVDEEMFDLTAKYYSNYGLNDLFYKTVLESSRELAKEIFLNSGRRENFEDMLNTLCALGWGIPEYRRDENKLLLKFKFAPISKNTPIFRALVINGFINFIFGDKYEIEKIRVYKKYGTIEFFYQMND